MTLSPFCDGCGSRIPSRIGRVDIDPIYQICVACHRKMRAEGVTFGEDFDPDELWADNTEEGDE